MSAINNPNRLTTMNEYKVTLTINTYSDNVEEWLVDAIDEVMEDDESINSIHVESIKPVYIHDMRFNHRDDALYYCRVNQLSPTLIHHTKSGKGSKSNDNWLD
jgi:hypothetical protein